MAWIELHQSLPQHRKLLALRDALGLRTPAALGHMCLLWLWALDNAPDGDLSALPARQLAEICQFSERRAGDLAVALRTSYEELLGLSGAILAALCVRCGDGATLRLPKQAVHDALETYEFAAAADGEDYVLSYRERAT